MEQEPEYAEVGWDIADLAIVPHRLCVCPTSQRQGVAAALLEKAEDLALECGCNRIRIDTSTMNEGMQRLLRKLGTLLFT